jgi:hypothetical protein
MNRITRPFRVRVLEVIMRMLGRAVDACIGRLLVAGVDAPEIAVLFSGDETFEHPDTVTERLLVIQILEQPGPRSHAELRDALSDLTPGVIYAALEELESEDILYIGREQVWATPCVRHLDRLDLIAL